MQYKKYSNGWCVHVRNLVSLFKVYLEKQMVKNNWNPLEGKEKGGAPALWDIKTYETIVIKTKIDKWTHWTENPKINTVI